MIARSLVGLFLAGLLLATSGLTACPVGAADERCFTETGKCVGGAFLRYWEAHGGLAQQGLPLTAEFPEVSPTNGKTYTVQYFERARFEGHPENTAPYDVLLGLLGREQHTLKYAASTPVPESSLPGGGECRAFASTAKQACGPFLRYWEVHGGLAQQGLPLTGVFWEVNPTNAQRYQVQYFERARFEYHPENAAPYDVLLGLLGREQYRAKYATALGPGAWAKVIDTTGTTGLRLRQAPAPWETLLAVLPEGSLVQIAAGPLPGGNGNPWCNVLAAGKTGWVDSTYLELAGSLAAPPAPAPIPSPQATALTVGSWAQVSGTAGTPGLNLRATASATDRQLAVLPEGLTVHLLEGPVTGTNGDPWYRLAWNGSWGWADGIYLIPTDAPTSTAPAPVASSAPVRGSARGDALVQVAMAQVGKPYVWGGTGPDGFDCSGLTLFAARKALGVTLPRVAVDQFKAGVAVKPDELQPGDLVFYANTYTTGISHVGIYIGGGRWVSALDEKIGVKAISLDEPYWKQRYAGARRIT
jgi:cell wall-associated NlpC family hydrolase